MLDTLQDLLVLALRRLIGEIRDQRVALVTKVSRNRLAATEQFGATGQQAGANQLCVRHSHSGGASTVIESLPDLPAGTIAKSTYSCTC